MKEQLFTATVLMAVLIALRYLLRGRINLNLQYALWLLLAVRLLVPFSVGSSPISVLNLTVPPAKAASHTIAQTAGTSIASDSDKNLPVTSAPQKNDPSQTSTPVSSPERATGHMSGDIATTPPVYPNLDQGLWYLWLGGAAAMGLWFLTQNLLLYHRLRRDRTPMYFPDTKRPVYLTENLPSPCLFGLIRPAIYLTPTCVEHPDALPYVLAHEETHYRHGDHIWSFVRCICLALYWFHPLVWWSAALSRTDCELACDQSTLTRIGPQHRREYGHTLLRLATGRSKPADLLCGATTMSASKSTLKERILMLANRPKMLISTCFVVALILGLTVGCTFTGSRQDPIPLTEEELAYFNGGEFFNGREGPNWIGEYSVNIPNMFLSSFYDTASQIDLGQLFYFGTGQVEQFAGQKERQAAYDALAWTPGADNADDCIKISRSNMEQVFFNHTGVDLEEYLFSEDWVYLAQYDAYYHVLQDSVKYRETVTFYKGERHRKFINLYYQDTQSNNADKVVTLKETKDGYLFVSNHISTYNRYGSVTNPEGEWPPALSAPTAVTDGIYQYIQQTYQDLVNEGSQPTFEELQGVPPEEADTVIPAHPVLFDTWQVDSLSLADTVTAKNGRIIDVYQFTFRIHTTTPEYIDNLKEGLFWPLPALFGMKWTMDEDGWLTYDAPLYQAAETKSQGPPYSVTITRTDCVPGDSRFTTELLYAYERDDEHNFTTLQSFTYPWWKTFEFFDLFEEGNYDAMKTFCTPQCVETYFQKDSVLGMETAKLATHEELYSSSFRSGGNSPFPEEYEYKITVYTPVFFSLPDGLELADNEVAINVVVLKNGRSVAQDIPLEINLVFQDQEDDPPLISRFTSKLWSSH